MSNPNAHSTPAKVWVPALVFTTSLLGFFIVAYFRTPVMSDDQRNLARLLFALLAGFSASFLTGTALLKFDVPQTPALKLTLSATAGLAILVFVYSVPPYWARSTSVVRDARSDELEYTGRVTDANSNKPIGNAKVSVEEDRTVPAVYQTDSEGIFHLHVHAAVKTVRIRVDAVNYQLFDRNVSVERSGVENIELAPIPTPAPSQKAISKGSSNHPKENNSPYKIP